LICVVTAAVLTSALTVAFPLTASRYHVSISTLWVVIELWLVVAVVSMFQARLNTCLSKLAAIATSAVPSPHRPALTKTTRTGEGRWFTFASCEMQGWRDAMEDAVVCVPCVECESNEEFALFAVFDGHGGRDASAAAAEEIAGRVGKRLAIPEEPKVALKNALLDIEEELRKRSMQPTDPHHGPQPPKGRCRLDFMGCTATVALLSRTSVTVANVGDSRVFKCRAGECMPLTRDHKPESPRERRRIEAAGGMVLKIGACHRVDCNLNLSRALGDFKYKDPRLAPEDQKISPMPDVMTADIGALDEFLVLGCDGLYELMTWNSVCAFVRKRIQEVPLATIAESLLDECCSPDMALTEGRGTDNESVIIVRLSGP